MIARSESWRKKADSNDADSTVLEGGQIRSRQGCRVSSTSRNFNMHRGAIGQHFGYAGGDFVGVVAHANDRVGG